MSSSTPRPGSLPLVLPLPVCGVQGYLSQYAGEEQTRLFSDLSRHYFIEGRRVPMLKNSYMLMHLKNPDFENGTTNWNACPAAAGSITTKAAPGLGTLQGRLHQPDGLGDVEWVECMGALPLEFITMHYSDGRQMLVMNTDAGTYGGKFVVEVWGKRQSDNTPVRTNLQSEGTGDVEFLAAGPRVVKLFRQMVRTGTAPIPYERTLAWMRVIEAARRAQRLGKRVYLRSIK